VNKRAKHLLALLPRFMGWNRFISDFRKRNRFSLRHPALKWRCSLSKAKQENPDERIIYIGETNWMTVAGGFWTWAQRESETVSCLIDNNEKETFPVIAGVDAARVKLPLTVIGKGKVSRCLTALKHAR
jgi:hypothetical protein